MGCVMILLRPDMMTRGGRKRWTLLSVGHPAGAQPAKRTTRGGAAVPPVSFRPVASAGGPVRSGRSVPAPLARGALHFRGALHLGVLCCSGDLREPISRMRRSFQNSI
jgi:hypothetical protein